MAGKVISHNGKAISIVLFDGCHMPVKLPSMHVRSHPQITVVSLNA